MPLRLPFVAAGGLFLCLGIGGCGPQTTKGAVTVGAKADGDTLAPGVVHRAIGMANGTGVDVVDVDLGRARVSIKIAAEGVGRVNGMIGGRAWTPREWLDRTQAVASTNGGYFGRADSNGREEFVGLLVQGGKVRHASPVITGNGGGTVRAGRYVRSAFGITASGVPEIVWAGTEAGDVQRVREYSSAVVGRGVTGRVWRVREAVGCGPRLVSKGHMKVTDGAERLVSMGARARTFVAYDNPGGAPRHFVLGMASGMEYGDAARFVMSYFAKYDNSRAAEAMCVDGGASTQMSYREAGGGVQSPRETGVGVPDAVVIKLK